MWRQHARAPEAVAARPVIRPLPPWWRRASQSPHPRRPEQAETGARADLGHRTRGTPTLWPCLAARRWAAEASGGARLVPGGGRKRACATLEYMHRERLTLAATTARPSGAKRRARLARFMSSASRAQKACAAAAASVGSAASTRARGSGSRQRA